MDELTSLVQEYATSFDANDAVEWNIVLSEIKNFLEVISDLVYT